MPNRILRDWTDSEVIDKLSPKAEVFFVRLIMKADDFGCYYANEKLLKANLYPLRENMRPSDITPLLRECVLVGLVRTYTAAGKDFLLIPKFGQRLRQKTRKFPEPPDYIEENKHDSNMRSIDSNMRLETEVEDEVEDEDEGQKFANVNHAPELIEAFKNFNLWVDKTSPNVRKIKKQINIDQFEKLKKVATSNVIRDKLEFLHNTPKYWQGKDKKQDVYLTIKNWIKRDAS